MLGKWLSPVISYSPILLHTNGHCSFGPTSNYRDGLSRIQISGDSVAVDLVDMQAEMGILRKFLRQAGP